MKIDNKEFFQIMFPSMKRIMKADSPLYSNLMLYGAAGMGKTLGIESIIEKAQEKYGPENVHATITDGDVGLALSIGFDSRPIQIVAIDDLTLRKVNQTELEGFYKCRHLALANGMKHGYILTILVVHDFFAIPKHLRTYFDFLIACNPPTNQFDKNFLKQYLGGEIIRELFRLQRKKRIDDNLKAIKAYWFLGQSGFIKQKKPIIGIKKLSGWEDVIPNKYSPKKLKAKLDLICKECQRKKGVCKLSRICKKAYENLSKHTGIKLDQLLGVFTEYAGQIEESYNKKKAIKAIEKIEKEEIELGDEGEETETDMYDEDYEEENK